VSAFSDWLAQKLPGPANFLETSVMPAVGKFIESPFAVPLVVADKVVNEIYRRPVATAFTVAQGLQSRDPISIREAYNLTDREALPGVQITPGQAAATFLGQNLFGNTIARTLLDVTDVDEKVYKMIPFLNPEFELEDTDERKKAFKDSFWGSFITGTGDIAFELAGAKGAGAAIKGTKLATGITRNPGSAKFLDQTRTNVLVGSDAYKAQNFPKDLKDFRAPNGDSVRVFEILNAKTGTELLSNPYFRSRPDLADLAAATRTWEEAAGFYLMAQGDTLAARALKQTAPSIEDALKERMKIEKLRPLTPDELSKYSIIPTKQKQKEMEAIFQDIVKREPQYKDVAKDFAAEAASIANDNPGWAPSQYSFIEKARLKKEQFKNLRYSGKGIDDITENIIGGGLLRPFVYFSVRSTDQRPFNYVQLSGPRIDEITNEMSAFSISSKVTRRLRDSKDPLERKQWQELNESMLRDIRANMKNETLLKRTIRNYEERILIAVVSKVAKDKGLEIDNAKDVVESLLAKRDVARNAAIRETMILDETRGQYVKLNQNLKTLLSDSVPLIDLDKFARTAISEIESKSTLRTDAGRNATISFDAFNSAFSASVLIRPGYIPKNSIIEPQFRYFATTGKLMEGQFLLPAVANYTRNIGSNLDAKFIAPYSKEARRINEERRVSVLEKKKVLESDLPNLNKQLEEAKQYAKTTKSKKARELVADIEAKKKAVELSIARLNKRDTELAGDLETYIAERKGPRKTITEMDEVIDVFGKKQKLESIWLGSGGRAAVQEVDGTQSAVNAVGPLKGFEAISGTSIKKTVTRESKDYWNSWAELVEKLRLNDASFKMALEGKSSPQIAKALMDDYNRRGQSSDLMRLTVTKRLDDLDEGKTADTSKVVPDMDDARFFALEAVEMSNKLLPDDGLKQAALSRPITVKEIKARYENAPESELPSMTALVPVEDLTAGIKFLNTLEKGYRKAFGLLVKPETNLYRVPFAKREANDALQVLMRKAYAQGVEVDAALYERYKAISRQYAIRKVEDTFYQVRRFNNAQFYTRFVIGFSAAMFNSLRFWGKAGLNNPYNFALLEQIRSTPWDIGMVVGERGELVDRNGWLINDKGQYVNEEGTAVSQQNKVMYDGETYLTLPYYQDIWAKVQGKPGYEGLRPYTKKINTRMFGFLVNGPNPAWLGQLALGGILVSNPQLEPKIKNVLDWDGQGNRQFGNLVFAGRPAVSFRPTVGETVEEGVLFFVPQWVREGWNLSSVTKDRFFAEDGPGADLDKDNPDINNKIIFSRGRMGDTMWYVHNARRYNGELEDPNFNPDLKTTENIAYGILTMRFLERLFSPFGITYQPQSQMFQDEKIKLTEYYANNPELRKGMTAEDAAMADLIAKHGTEKLSALFGFTTGGRERPVGVEYSTTGITTLKENRKLVEDFMRANPRERITSIGILTYDPIPGEFSDVAYAAYDQLSLAGIKLGGEKRSFAEREAERSIRQGWFEYNKLISARDAELAGRVSKSLSYRGNQDIARRFSDQIQKLKTEIPAWGNVFGDSRKTFDQNLILIEEVLNKDLIEKMEGPKRQMWEQITVWHSEYREVSEDYREVPTSNQRLRSAIRDYWEDRTSQLRLENTYFADFHTRWLSGDEVIDVNELLKSELKPALPMPSGMGAGQPTIQDMFKDLGNVG
jgi:hypothetical protein